MKYHSRKFLNKTKGLGAIEVSFEASHSYIESHVQITDCIKSIRLDFCCFSKKECKEKQAKISLLVQELLALQNKIAEVEETFNFDRTK